MKSLKPRVGEVLEFELSMNGGVYLGEAQMRVIGTVTHQGVECVVFESRATSGPFLSHFYPIDNRAVSFWDPQKRRTLWHQKRIKEGNFYLEFEAELDYASGQASWRQSGYSEELTLGRERGVTEPLPDSLQDALSAIYLSRLDLEAGHGKDRLQLALYDDLQEGSLELVLLGRGELEHELGGDERRYSILKVGTRMESSGLFRARGDVEIWVSDDENRYPLQIQIDTSVGNIIARLREVRQEVPIKVTGHSFRF